MPLKDVNSSNAKFTYNILTFEQYLEKKNCHTNNIDTP